MSVKNVMQAKIIIDVLHNINKKRIIGYEPAGLTVHPPPPE